ncbi:MAG: Crp/Fnr family transcriptional regulator [Saprospiraceae bacterium]
MKQVINVSEDELNDFLNQAVIRTFKRQETISRPDDIPNEIFFINKGLIRVLITDNEGTEHTIHFALENQFIADYSNFIQVQPSIYGLQTLEETEVVILPRTTIEWGYKNLIDGQKMGRLIADCRVLFYLSRRQN